MKLNCMIAVVALLPVLINTGLELRQWRLQAQNRRWKYYKRIGRKRPSFKIVQSFIANDKTNKPLKSTMLDNLD